MIWISEGQIDYLYVKKKKNSYWNVVKKSNWQAN